MAAAIRQRLQLAMQRSERLAVVLPAAAAVAAYLYVLRQRRSRARELYSICCHQEMGFVGGERAAVLACAPGASGCIEYGV